MLPCLVGHNFYLIASHVSMWCNLTSDNSLWVCFNNNCRNLQVSEKIYIFIDIFSLMKIYILGYILGYCWLPYIWHSHLYHNRILVKCVFNDIVLFLLYANLIARIENVLWFLWHTEYGQKFVYAFRAVLPGPQKSCGVWSYTIACIFSSSADKSTCSSF